MEATAVRERIGEEVGFWESAVGKKVIMALTGLLLLGFLAVHLLGNLQLFAGRERLNAYAVFLREEPALLWAVRMVLIAALFFHVLAAAQLQALRARARPQGYGRRNWYAATWASRSMLASGLVLLGFVVYHLLDLTFGVVNPGFVAEDVYGNVVGSFARTPVAVGYVLALLMIGAHLFHGIGAMFRSGGVHNRRWTQGLALLGAFVAVAMTAGYASLPLAVLLGWVGP